MRKLIAPLAISGSLVAGGIAGAVLGVPGLSGAQTDGGSATTPDSSTAAPERTGPIETALEKLVADGTITEDQAGKIAAALKAEMGNRKPPGGHGRHMGPKLDAAASALGMSVDDLATELRSGKTIAQVAQDKGVDVQSVIDALVSAATDRIDAAVESGKLDETKAAELKSGLRDKITQMVNEAPPAEGRGFHKGPRGFDGPPPADEAPAADQTAA